MQAIIYNIGNERSRRDAAQEPIDCTLGAIECEKVI